MPDTQPTTPAKQFLADLNPGATAVVLDLDFSAADSVRLMELGFIPGISVSCQRSVPMGDLAVYEIDGTQIAIRKETASRIGIRTERGGGVDNASGD